LYVVKQGGRLALKIRIVIHTSQYDQANTTREVGVMFNGKRLKLAAVLLVVGFVRALRS